MPPPSKPSSTTAPAKSGLGRKPTVRRAKTVEGNKPKSVTADPVSLKVKAAPKAPVPDKVAEPAKITASVKEASVPVKTPAKTIEKLIEIEAVEPVLEAPVETPISSDLAVAAALIEAPAVEIIEVEETIPHETIATTEAVSSHGKAEGKIKMTEALQTGKKFAAEAKEKLQAAYIDINAKAKAALEKSGKVVEELGDITRGNVEAVVESSKIAAKGVETLNQDAAEFGRRQFEKTSAAIKSFSAAKTPAEFFQLQSDLLASSFDLLASESAQRSEAFLKLASDIVQPISTRFSVVSEKVKSLAA